MRLKGSLFIVVGFAAALAAGWGGLPHLLYRTHSQPLQFSHKAHTDKAGLTCDGCHSLTEAGYFTGIPERETCAGCHAEPVTDDPDEKLLVDQYLKPQREIEWLVYSRQPQNVRFSHAIHLKRAKLECESCHGQHGKTGNLRIYQENRISGYSRDIWGYSISRISTKPPKHPPMKMDDCIRCHDRNAIVTGCRACHK
jgi:hypothetical protein